MVTEKMVDDAIEAYNAHSSMWMALSKMAMRAALEAAERTEHNEAIEKGYAKAFVLGLVSPPKDTPHG